LDGSTNDAADFSPTNTFALQAGVAYRVTYWISGNQRSGQDTLTVTFAGQTNTHANIPAAMPFSQQILAVTPAASTNARLVFSHSGGDNLGIILDDVAVEIATAGPAPAVTLVTNSASNTLPGLPSSGIAQGSLFIAKGTNLGPAAIIVATTFPLSTSIGGTSVKVTVGSVTRDAIMYYSSAGQIAAILPSAIPTGSGTITVTYNGATSAAFPINVVKTTIGVFTFNTTGGGDAVATLGAGFVGPLNAANPGEAVAFWATGLGPVNADETQPAPQFDMTDIPLEAWMGGKPATVLFRGRNGCCSSVDVIYLEVPQGASGCMTPVVFKTGDYVSNTVSIPTALSGRVCTPAVPTLTSADVTRMLSQPRIAVGGFNLFRLNPFPGAEPSLPLDGGNGAFVWAAPVPGGLGILSFDVPSFGSCMVYTGGQVSGFFLGGGALPAGSLTNVTGPAGLRQMGYDPSTNLYGAVFDAGGNFLRPGQFSITAPGGTGVGPINASSTFPQTLQWTNAGALANVDRAAGVTIEWSGGDPDGYVRIVGNATSSGSPAAGALFICNARIGDGRFTVPPYVTLAMPQSNPAIPPALPAFWPSVIWVDGMAAPSRFQATGLDFGIVYSWVGNGRTLSFTGAVGVP
jgi:uncharacterized protein (TIGR03437 family)